jgi:hypothetical protein
MSVDTITCGSFVMRHGDETAYAGGISQARNASAAVEVMLRGLKMYGMAQAVGELIEQGAPAFTAAVPILSQLLKAEMSEREVRSIAYQIKAARFPAYKDLAGFDFASSEVNEALVRQLHCGEFIDGAHNVVAVGGPGTGKTHIATALGVQAVEHHRKKVRFGSRQHPVLAALPHSPPSIWSICWSRKKLQTRQGNWRSACCGSTSSSSTSWDTCRSARQAERCCSTCSANSMNAPASSSPPTSASANGPLGFGMIPRIMRRLRCSATPK